MFKNFLAIPFGMILTQELCLCSNFVVNVGVGDRTTWLGPVSGNPNNPMCSIQKNGEGDLVVLKPYYLGSTIIAKGRWFMLGGMRTSVSTPISIEQGASLIGPGPIKGEVQVDGNLSASKGMILEITAINENYQGPTMEIIGDVHHSGKIVAGSTNDDIRITGNLKSENNPHIEALVSPAGEASQIHVSGSAKLASAQDGAQSYTVDVMLESGKYTKGTIDYLLMEANEGIRGCVTQLTYCEIKNNNDNPVFELKIGKGRDNQLILQMIVSEDFNVDETQALLGERIDQYSEDGSNGSKKFTYLTINSSDKFLPDSGIEIQNNSGTAPVAEQPDFSSIVSQSMGSANDALLSSSSDNFRHLRAQIKSIRFSRNNNATENILLALGQLGPISKAINETRIWLTPYMNRVRASNTSSESGYQGWAGGAIGGVERRDKKNTWCFGLLSGVTVSSTHVLGQPDTSSKTKGLVVGVYNTLKYNQYFGHEILVSRTWNLVQSSRFGKGKTSNSNYTALGDYKMTTDILNGQINCILDLIKKKATARINVGSTYTRENSGKVIERGAGLYNLMIDNRVNSNVELYAGLGLRRIINYGKSTIRATVVYEYGYELMKKSSLVHNKFYTLSQSQTYVTYASSKRQNKHYCQFNTSYLNRENGIKFIVSYAGKYWKNVKNHTWLFKAEYRF